MIRNIVTLVACLLMSLSAFATKKGVNVSQTEKINPAGRVSVSVEPLWLLISGIGSSVDYNISSRLSAGVRFMGVFGHQVNSNSEDSPYVDPYGYVFDYKEVNLGVTYMLTGNLGSSGIYVNPSIGYSKTEISDFGVLKLSGEHSTPRYRATVGYRWGAVSNKNINFIAGLGYQAATGGAEVTIKNSAGKVIYEENASATGGLALDLGMRYTF